MSNAEQRDPAIAADHPPSERSDLMRVAVLERSIGASLERVWENVLDWEHLPWLHRDAFAQIERIESGDWGWRARAASRGRPDQSFDIELLVERDLGRYVSRTKAGKGPSAEIWTWLVPGDENATDIHVEFWLPNMTAETRDHAGRAFLTLYQQLWDEDEAMMQWRSARLAEGPDAPPSDRIDLGPEDALRAGLPRCLGEGRRRVRVVELDGEIYAHATRCPHMLGPLDGADADGVPAGEVRCPWHGYRFDVRTGRSSDARGLRLPRAPRVVIEPDTRHVVLDFGDA